MVQNYLCEMKDWTRTCVKISAETNNSVSLLQLYDCIISCSQVRTVLVCFAECFSLLYDAIKKLLGVLQ